MTSIVRHISDEHVFDTTPSGLDLHHSIDVETSAELAQNGQEVMQVIVVHLDLFTCGVCGHQSTDVLDHLLHKSHHLMTNMYSCELCGMAYASRDSLIHHYGQVHSLAKLLNLLGQHTTETQDLPQQTAETTASDHQIVVLAEDQLLQIDNPEQPSQPNSTLTYGQETPVPKALVDRLFTDSKKVDTVPKSLSSRARSKQLLKTAMRTLTNPRSTDPSGVHSVSTTTCVRSTLSRRPPILQRRPAELKKTTCSVTLATERPKVSRKRESPTIKPPVATATVTSAESAPFAELDQCLHCDYSSRSREELTEHMNARHKQSLELPDSLQMAAIEESPVKKPESSERGKVKKPRQPRKVERQDLPGVYPCSQCGKSFMRLRYLRKHAHVHKTDRKFVCDECGKLFRCKGYLKIHQRKLHTREEKLFKCNQCDFESSINIAIHAHRQIHSQGSVLCDICGYAYTDKATLAKHKRVHDPRRPFACNFPGCTWRFKTEIMCKAHIRAHTTEGKFRCAVCGYVFRHKHHLQRHEANMHGIQHEKSRQKTPNNLVDIILSSTELGKDEDCCLPQHFFVIKPEEDGSHTAVTYDSYDLGSEVIHSQDITEVISVDSQFTNIKHK